jgi:hypothetical protein
VFSTTQRSLQARNKEYNILGRDKGESYETRQRREEAGRILESTEMVIWWSAARGEVCSIYLYLYLSLSLSLSTCIFLSCSFQDAVCGYPNKNHIVGRGEIEIWG